MRVTAFSARNNTITVFVKKIGKDGDFLLFYCEIYVIIILYTFVGVIFLNTQRVQNLLLAWYSEHFRALPWRVDATPYHIWVSEIMLQQTRIEAVLPYYRRFIDALPDVATLAAVSEDVLLKLWEGLGYYSRARNLQKAARIVQSDYNGELPADYERLLALPGIGEYTAGAIASIAYGIPVPAVDGNVMRVLARLTSDYTDVLSTAGKKRFTDLAWDLIPEQQAGRFNQAIMELGETVCLPGGAAKCTACPLRTECFAYHENAVSQLPVRVKKTKKRVEQRAVLIVRAEDDLPKVLLHRREDSGLLAGLWELPNTLSTDPLDALPEPLRNGCVYSGDLPDSKHLFSHIEWQMKGYLYDTTSLQVPDRYAFVTLQELQQIYPLPSAFAAYTRVLNDLLCKEI